MSGKGDAIEAPHVEKGYEYRSISDPTQLYPISEPFGIYENNPEGIDDTTDTGEYRKLGSMVSAFANSYYETTGVPIVGVSSSEGATCIGEWKIEGAFYDDAISRILSAKAYLDNNGYRLRHTYVVWCQGESDGDKGVSGSDYYKELKSLTDNLIEAGYAEQVFIIAI